MKKKKLSVKSSSPKLPTKNTQLLLFLGLVIISALLTTALVNSAREAEIYALRTPIVKQPEKNKTPEVKKSASSLNATGNATGGRSGDKPSTPQTNEAKKAAGTLNTTATGRVGNADKPSTNTTSTTANNTTGSNTGGSGAIVRDTARLKKDGDLRVPSLPAPAATTYTPASGNGSQSSGGVTERKSTVHYDAGNPNPSKEPASSKEPRSSKDPAADVREQMKKDAEKVKDNLQNIQQQAQDAGNAVKKIVGPVVEAGVEVANSAVDIGQSAASIAIRQGGINTANLTQFAGRTTDLAVNTAAIPVRSGLYLGSLGARQVENAAQTVTSATNTITNKVTNVTNAITGIAANSAITMESNANNPNFGANETERAQIAQGAELYRQLQETGDAATETTENIGDRVTGTTESIGEASDELAGDLKDAAKPKSFASRVANTLTQPVLDFFSGIADYVGGN